MKFSLRIVVAKWLPIAITIVGIGSFAYIGMHQMNRAALNEPQIQMVEEAVTALARGAVPAEIVPHQDAATVDLNNSLAPFIGVYDESGQPLETSGVLSGQPPKPPIGVFTSALSTGENRVTWQPEGGVRIALVVKPVSNSRGWYVAAGRSMREGEAQLDNLWNTAIVIIGFTLMSTLVLEVFGAWRHVQQVNRKSDALFSSDAKSQQ